MADDAEQQAEEIVVLNSIYYGYPYFKQVNPTTYQYWFGEGTKSFIFEIIWGPTYPSEKPKFNLDIFYNQHLHNDSHVLNPHFILLLKGFWKTSLKEIRLPSVREKILAEADAEAEKWLGYAMTFSIFERLKDKVDEILEEQTEEAVAATVEKIIISEQAGPSKKLEKKEQLSKSQKRRAWDRAEAGRAGERPRGWNWIDIIKHLSQTPRQQSPD